MTSQHLRRQIPRELLQVPSYPIPEKVEVEVPQDQKEEGERENVVVLTVTLSELKREHRLSYDGHYCMSSHREGEDGCVILDIIPPTGKYASRYYSYRSFDRQRGGLRLDIYASLDGDDFPCYHPRIIEGLLQHAWGLGYSYVGLPEYLARVLPITWIG